MGLGRSEVPQGQFWYPWGMAWLWSAGMAVLNYGTSVSRVCRVSRLQGRRGSFKYRDPKGTIFQSLRVFTDFSLILTLGDSKKVYTHFLHVTTEAVPDGP